MPETLPPGKRFWRHVEQRGPDECWLWQASKNKDGYGAFQSGLAHRHAWLLSKGEIPNGLYVLHKCDNPGCCNPQHLFIGTQKDNMADMRSKGRGPDTKGSANGRAKLSEDDVLEIRKRRANGLTITTLAAIYGVSLNVISLIDRREIWTHI
jgi:hypothetical protein